MPPSSDTLVLPFRQSPRQGLLHQHARDVTWPHPDLDWCGLKERRRVSHLATERTHVHEGLIPLLLAQFAAADTPRPMAQTVVGVEGLRVSGVRSAAAAQTTGVPALLPRACATPPMLRPSGSANRCVGRSSRRRLLWRFHAFSSAKGSVAHLTPQPADTAAARKTHGTPGSLRLMTGDFSAQLPKLRGKTAMITVFSLPLYLLPAPGHVPIGYNDSLEPVARRHAPADGTLPLAYRMNMP
jgi:hypothetical protein